MTLSAGNPQRFFFWLTAFFSLAITLAGASRKQVSPVDASMRASMARHIVETHQLFPPHYDGEVLLDHPPGYIWAIAASFKVFGVNDFAAQFPGRLSAFLSLLLVWLIGRRMGLQPVTAFFAAFILGTTRDFIVIAMQGGIEPLLNLWCWLGFYLILPEPGDEPQPKRAIPYFKTALSALCVILAAFTKGPPAILPLLFFAGYLLLRGPTWQARVMHLLVYFFALALGALIWAWYIAASGDLWYWKWYWSDQVVGSALRGRNMQHKLDLFYFCKIILQDYWPWLPLLFFAVIKKIKNPFPLRLPAPEVMALLFALGFFAGFSIVKWKFWYYIAPSFPGFAIFIAAALDKNATFHKILATIRFEKSILVLCCAWILIVSIFPVKMSSGSMSEIQVFKETLKAAPGKDPVWFVEHPGDHNMYATSGNWYFNRIVKKVSDVAAWEKSLSGETWVLTGAENFRTCKAAWCRSVDFSQTSGISTLARIRMRP